VGDRLSVYSQLWRPVEAEEVELNRYESIDTTCRTHKLSTR
jgi:hypothetical protein